MDSPTDPSANLETNLTDSYALLQLSNTASLDDVDKAYFRLKTQCIQTGDRTSIPSLKAARETLRQHITDQILSEPIGSPIEKGSVNQSDHSNSAPSRPTSNRYTHNPASTANQNGELDPIYQVLCDRGFSPHLTQKGTLLHIGIQPQGNLSPAQTVAKVRDLLSEIPLEELDFSTFSKIQLYGLNPQNKPLWKKSFSPPHQHLAADDINLFSFRNRYSNVFFFPILLLIGALLNVFQPIQLMLFGVDIWIHELGHATVAWLSGHRATPVPFGWTNVGPERSLFVYFGILTLLGLLFWSGLKENRRWPMGLAIMLAVIQFFMTWIVSDDTYEMLLSFGGIGGEFYLSALFIISFYFPLPERWRWDFFRYPTVTFASFTFLGSLWQWRQIKRGFEDIPWGSLLGGSEHIGGDMNQLSIVYGWSDWRIIDTYNTIGSLCLITIISLYIYVFVKNDGPKLLASLKPNNQ